MKIAIVRGASLNDWEIQNFLPLAKRHELMVVGTRGRKYNFGEKIRISRPICLGEVLNYVPKGTELLYRFFGDPQVIFGLEKEISGFDIVHVAELGNF